MKKLIILSMSAQVIMAAFCPYQQIILRNKGYSHSLCGVLIALTQLSAIILPLIISTFSDKTSKAKSFIFFSAFFALAFSIPYLLSLNIYVVVITAFIMCGLIWSINPLCDGYINRALKNDTSRYGAIRSMGTLSYMVILILFSLSGFPNESDNKSILLALTICFSVLLVAVLFVKEIKSDEKKKESGAFFSFSWFPKRFYIFMLIIAITRIAHSIVEKLLSSYMVEDLKLGRFFLLFVALGAFCEFLCMILFSYLRRKNKVNSWDLLVLSSVGLALRLLLYLVPSVWAFTVAQMLHGLTFGANHVAATGYAADNVAPEHYGVAMTLYWSLAVNLPQMMGAFGGGFIIESFGYPMLFLSYSIFPIIGIILSFVLKKTLI